MAEEKLDDAETCPDLDAITGGGRCSGWVEVLDGPLLVLVLGSEEGMPGPESRSAHSVSIQMQQ